MQVGYIIVGTLWAACTIGFLAAGATGNVAAAVLAGLIVSITLSLPVALLVGGLWRLTTAVMDAVRSRRRHHLLGAR